jgi:hypothetical protein
MMKNAEMQICQTKIFLAANVSLGTEEKGWQGGSSGSKRQTEFKP